MRRILTILSCLLIGFVIFAQKDVTKFLGIPVDGPKSEMIRKLKAKGFTPIRVDDVEVLNGRFNGVDVNVHIYTENGKVSRIMICDDNTMNETDIKIRFNRLCQQFKGNGKYVSIDDFTIPEDDDISYEMAVRNKRYQALFYQLPEGVTSKQLQIEVLTKARAKYTPEQLLNLSDDAENGIIAEALSELIDIVHNKPVWFMITERYGTYYITMFYDNEYNRAQGEDL